jgi:hypothetical protein
MAIKKQKINLNKHPFSKSLIKWDKDWRAFLANKTELKKSN